MSRTCELKLRNMIWTDGSIYKCLSNTNFSPADYALAWEKI